MGFIVFKSSITLFGSVCLKWPNSPVKKDPDVLLIYNIQAKVTMTDAFKRILSSCTGISLTSSACVSSHESAKYHDAWSVLRALAVMWLVFVMHFSLMSCSTGNRFVRVQSVRFSAQLLSRSLRRCLHGSQLQETVGLLCQR